MGMDVDMNTLYGRLYNKALEGDPDCGGLLAYNYFSGEHITGFDEGRPLFVRSPESRFNLANFMRVHLFTSLGALKTGMDILLKKEHVRLDRMMGHGGLFKTEGVGQRIMAGAIDTPVYVMETAGEGGAWGDRPSGRLPGTKGRRRRSDFLSGAQSIPGFQGNRS